MSNALKIPNKFILGLASWLAEQPLGGRESRERSRFVTVASEHLQEVEKERKEIIEKFANKDEDGKPKIITVDNGDSRYDIPDEKKAEMEKEYLDLLDEEWVLDVSEGNKAKIKTTRDILLNTEYKFGPKEGDTTEEQIAKVRQANDYDKWCQFFEVLDL